MSEITWEIFKMILEEDILIYIKRVNGMKSMLNIQNNIMDIFELWHLNLVIYDNP